MSRPAVPTITAPAYPVRTFATDTDYPVGPHPWSNQPIKVEPPGPNGGFVPDQDASAEYFNRLFFDGFTQDQAAKDYETAHAAEVQADFAALYSYLGQLPALNFSAGPAIVFNDAAWNAVRGRWVAVGNAKIIRESASQGQNFDANVAGSVVGMTDCLRIAADASGNMVVTGDSSTIFEWNQSTSTWTARSAVLPIAPAAGDAYAVVHDGTRWVAFTAQSGGRGYASSTDRITWTNRSAGVPSSVAATGGRQARLATNGAGRVVSCISIVSTTTTEFQATLDGGATWVGGTYATVNHGLSSIDEQSLAYDAVSALFVFTVTNASAGKVYTSSDGLSWTLAATLGVAGRIQRVATLGALWLAQVGSASLALSVDRGVTWRSVAYIPKALTSDADTITRVRASDGQFVVLTSTKVYPGLRAGIGGTVLT